MFSKIKNLILGSLLLVVCLVTSQPAFALTQSPDFSSCLNPQGTVKDSFSEGVHGIIGDEKSYSGSDTVYSINSNANLQCFCALDGNGIQTNWWKVGSLTEDQINSYETQGWIYVPNGQVWGLDSSGYLAKNLHFSCQGASSNNSSSSSSSDSGGRGAVLGIQTAVGTVLGLASTGNNLLLYILPILGFLTLTVGVLLRKGK